MGSISIPAELVQRIASGKCVGFVGSGLSQSAGLPGWLGALKQIVKWADQQGHSLQDREEIISVLDGPSPDLLMIAAELSDQLGKTRYRQALTSIFRPPSAQPREVHKHLVSIPFAGIATTNYDKLIETAYTVNGFALPLVSTHAQQGELAAIMSGERAFILKAHGDIDQFDTVVLGRRDYQDLLLNAAYQQCMSLLVAQYTLLFVGFSLTDPDLQLALGWHRAAFHGHTVNHYALMPEGGAGTVEARRYQRDYGITLLSYRPSTRSHPEVELFLSELCKIVAAKRSEYAPVSQLVVAQQSADVQLKELDRVKESIGASEYLRRLVNIARNLWHSGSRKQAWTLVIGPFERNSSALQTAERIEIAVTIASMVMEDVGPTRAAHLLRSLIPLAEQLDDAKLQFSFWELWARCLIGLHDLDGARKAIDRAISLVPGAAKSELEARSADAHLLAGQLDVLTDTPVDW